MRGNGEASTGPLGLVDRNTDVEDMDLGLGRERTHIICLHLILRSWGGSLRAVGLLEAGLEGGSLSRSASGLPMMGWNDGMRPSGLVSREIKPPNKHRA